jgi:Cu-processing system permease protein
MKASTTNNRHALKTLIVKEIYDSRRNPWIIGYFVVLAVLGLAIGYHGMSSAMGLSLQIFGRTTATLINLCLFVAPLVAVTLGAGSISGEKDRGTLEQLLSQPIERWEIVAGKYIGLLTVLTITTVAGFAPAACIVGLYSSPIDAFYFLLFPLLAVLVIGAMLAIGMLISVWSKGRAQAQLSAILVWFAFVLVYDLLLMGSLAIVRLSPAGLALLLLLNPIDAGRILVILALNPDLYILGPAGAYLVNTFGVPGTVGFLLFSIAMWTCLPILLAQHTFKLRLPRSHNPVKRPFLMKALQTASILFLLYFLVGCGGSDAKGPESENKETESVAKPTAIELTMTPEAIAQGHQTYIDNCAPCHGEGGKGDGPAAASLTPKPRDHTNGAYMDTLTNDRLFKVIKMGGAVAGFPNMPAHPHLNDETIKNVIAYVRTLSSNYKK